jgi:hypothetical protein
MRGRKRYHSIQNQLRRRAGKLLWYSRCVPTRGWRSLKYYFGAKKPGFVIESQVVRRAQVQVAEPASEISE